MRWGHQGFSWEIFVLAFLLSLCKAKGNYNLKIVHRNWGKRKIIGGKRWLDFFNNGELGLFWFLNM